VDEKSAEEQPNIDVVAPEIVVVALKVDLWIQFTTDRKFEQCNHILYWVRDDLAEKFRICCLD
jgi:hypothetical protein